MVSFNKVILLGNLTRDPELRHTPGGMTVCNFDLAVNRSFTTKGGGTAGGDLLHHCRRLGQAGADLRGVSEQGTSSAG
ncbi:MAG: single-stranded DNA-binding protein [Candidatus Methylomirabilis sp.]|nr:single-stranded DNA-binding protein [Candidatus Methylomirabilis sp.]